MKLTTLVFDLDDTLLDTTRLLIPIANTPEFESRIRQPLPLMEQALENLQRLKNNYKLILLTQGRKDAQQAKVVSCGLKENIFSEIVIVDPKVGESKSQFFKDLRARLQAHEQFMSIGNRRHVEIREAKRYAGLTCLFKYGEHFNEIPEVPEDIPDFVIDDHKNLIEVCKL